MSIFSDVYGEIDFAAPALVFDAETTGFDLSGRDRIVSLAGVLVEKGKIKKKTYYQEFNSGVRSSAGAEAVHKLSPQHLAQCPNFGDAIIGFEEMLKKARYMVAHNASFDFNFIVKEFDLIDSPLPISYKDDVIDTLQLARIKIKSKSYKLERCCEILAIPDNRTHHNALEDSLLTAELYIRLGKMINDDPLEVPEPEPLIDPMVHDRKSSAILARDFLSWYQN